MALNFPTSPSLDDVYVFEGRSWRWNGDGWNAIHPFNPLIADNEGVVDVSDELDDVVANGPVFLPSGTYNAPSYAAFGDWTTWGFGQVKDDGGDLRAPGHVYINDAPEEYAGYGEFSPLDTFNADFSKVHVANETFITDAIGSATGQPATGYYSDPPTLASRYSSVYFNSGWNEATGGNDGRTGYAADIVSIFAGSAGQGDISGYHANVSITGARAGATDVLANPAGGGFLSTVGLLAAGSAGGGFAAYVYDNGFDCAALPFYAALDRENDTGAIGAWWTGISLQSTGSAAVDSYLSGNGLFTYGIDFTSITFGTNKGAIAIKGSDKIWMNATSSDSRTVTDPGNAAFYYDEASDTFKFIADGVISLQIQNGAMFMGGALGDSLGAQLLTFRQTGWSAPTTGGGAISRGAFDTGANLATTAATLAALITDLRTHGLINT